MRIIYLHQYFNTPGMSGGTRSYEMARRLVRNGHQVDIITSRRDTGNDTGGWEITEEAGVTVHWYPVTYSNKMSYFQRIKAFFQFAFVAAKQGRMLGGDVVFATSTPLTIALPGIFISKVSRIPFVFEVRDLWPELPIAVGALKSRVLIKVARWMEHTAYRNADLCIALSPGMKEGIAATGYPEQKITVIPNSSDIELFDIPAADGQQFRQKHAWLEDRPLVVYTGTLGIINKVSYLAGLAARVQQINPEVRFLIVGGGKEFELVKEEAAERGVLEKNLFMWGRIPKNEIPVVLNAADLATSLFMDLKEMWANSANKFFDALASGTPVAINYGGWQADILKEEKAGIQLHPDNFEEAAIDLCNLLSDTERLRQFGENARRLAVNRFNRDELAREFENVLKKAVRND